MSENNTATLEQDNDSLQNTEVLNNNDPQDEITEDDQNNEPSDVDATDESDDSEVDIDNLSDEEFDEYLASGKVPDSVKGKKEKKEEPEDNSDESATDNQEKDSDTSNSSVDAPVSPSKDKARVISKPEEKTPQNQSESQIDYKGVYDRIFAPFKANGKDMTPKTVEDVISLMQMGANYTKKMQVLAPMRKQAETLNKAKITEEDLNFLIDVWNGDKAAIAQLLKKHEIEPLDIDSDSEYKPNNNLANDSDVAFADIVSDYTDVMPQIMETVKNWDKTSQSNVVTDPNVFRALGNEIRSGRFAKIQETVERERTYGRLGDMTDLQAVIAVAMKMDEEAKQSMTSNRGNAPQRADTSSNSNSNKSQYNKSKAAPTKTKASRASSALSPEDIFNMDEETFNKINLKDLE